MRPNEEKKEERGDRKAVGPLGKTRKVNGPSNRALSELVIVLASFLGDLSDPDVSVEEAANFAADNLKEYARKFLETDG